MITNILNFLFSGIDFISIGKVEGLKGLGVGGVEFERGGKRNRRNLTRHPGVRELHREG